MAKSKIIKELANNKVTLEVALSRLIVISYDIDDAKLRNWAENELNGYNDDDELPSYRKVTGQIKYTGIQNRGIGGILKITDAPLPITALPTEISNQLKEYDFRNGIKTLSGILEKDNGRLVLDLTYLAPIIYEANGIECTSIYMHFDKAVCEKVVNAVRTKLLNVFCELDSRLGNLDELDVSVANVDIRELKQFICNLIYDNSFKLGDNNSIENSKLVGGNVNGN